MIKSCVNRIILIQFGFLLVQNVQATNGPCDVFRNHNNSHILWSLLYSSEHML